MANKRNQRKVSPRAQLAQEAALRAAQDERRAKNRLYQQARRERQRNEARKPFTNPAAAPLSKEHIRLIAGTNALALAESVKGLCKSEQAEIILVVLKVVYRCVEENKAPSSEKEWDQALDIATAEARRTLQLAEQ